jgi:thioesterase domain-containing protein
MFSEALAVNANIERKKINSILTAFQVEGTQPPFFWIYGGKVVPLILEQMGPDQPFYLLNHQSMNGNRAKHLTIPEMASYYSQNILEIDSEGPYYLGGYSIGGMIMYEIARRLCEQGKKVALLFILDPTSISNDKNKQELPIQNLNFLSEYQKLKDIGYVTYFLEKIDPIKTKFQKQLEQIKIQSYFSLGKSLPVQLHWPYLLEIYKQASLNYQPEPPLEGIENAVIVHVNNREIEDWTSLFNGKINAHAVECNHLQLIETPYLYIWLKILKQTIKRSLGK